VLRVQRSFTGNHGDGQQRLEAQTLEDAGGERAPEIFFTRLHNERDHQLGLHKIQGNNPGYQLEGHGRGDHLKPNLEYP